MIATDFHVHVSYTSAMVMVEAARDRGLRALGLAEHVYQLWEGRSGLEHLTVEGPFMGMADYIAAVRTAAEQVGFDVRLGLEVDFIPDKNQTIQDVIKDQPWDFLIGSVHEIDGVEFESSFDASPAEGQMLWLHYFALQRAAIASGYFQVISHPVRMGRRNPYLPATFDDELEHLAAEAARYDVALEVDGKDILSYPSLVRRLIRACALQHTPVSIGSDAHYPQHIAWAHAQTEQLLHEAGISAVRIWRRCVNEEYTL
jgi:histidinol-phosphatase (PHP family)